MSIVVKNAFVFNGNTYFAGAIISDENLLKDIANNQPTLADRIVGDELKKYIPINVESKLKPEPKK